MQPAPASSTASSSFVVVAFAVEGGLAVVAMLAGWWLDRDPYLGLAFGPEAMPGNLRAVAWGTLACVPLLTLMGLLDRLTWSAWTRLQRILDEHLLPLFAAATPVERALICAAAGFGEELLFRGLLQGTLQALGSGPENTLLAVAMAAAMFGACHWVTPTYGVLATLMGGYFGGLLVLTDNILAPIVCHAVYDYVVLTWLLARKKNRQPSL